MKLEQHCQFFVSIIIAFIITIVKVARVYEWELMWNVYYHICLNTLLPAGCAIGASTEPFEMRSSRKYMMLGRWALSFYCTKVVGWCVSNWTTTLLLIDLDFTKLFDLNTVSLFP